MPSTGMSGSMFLENKEPLEPGLYVCPTPIGNLEDITLRVLRTLNGADAIAAEDTRHTLKLLNHYGIKKPLISYHEHNIRTRGPELLERIQKGERIALVSDAGMPGISDPGADIIRLCREADALVTVLPGPTASVTALVGSGFRTDRFLFEGFTDRKAALRRERLKQLSQLDGTVILYESPHRLQALLEDIQTVMGDVPVAVARELTKRYEENRKLPVSQWLARLAEQPVKGELVILFEGHMPVREAEMLTEDRMAAMLAEGRPLKEVARQLAEETGQSRNAVYQQLLQLRRE